MLGVYRWYDSLSIRGGLDFVNVSLHYMDTVPFTQKDLGPKFGAINTVNCVKTGLLKCCVM